MNNTQRERLKWVRDTIAGLAPRPDDTPETRTVNQADPARILLTGPEFGPIDTLDMSVFYGRTTSPDGATAVAGCAAGIVLTTFSQECRIERCKMTERQEIHGWDGVIGRVVGLTPVMTDALFRGIGAGKPSAELTPTEVAATINRILAGTPARRIWTG